MNDTDRLKKITKAERDLAKNYLGKEGITYSITTEALDQGILTFIFKDKIKMAHLVAFVKKLGLTDLNNIEISGKPRLSLNEILVVEIDRNITFRETLEG